MAIELTENAAKHITEMLKQRGQGIGLRLSTRESGCSGYMYEVDYADEIRDDDKVFQNHGASVVVDKRVLEIIDGLKIDFVKHNVLNQGFEFHNPNASDICGCGESFRI